MNIPSDAWIKEISEVRLNGEPYVDVRLRIDSTKERREYFSQLSSSVTEFRVSKNMGDYIHITLRLPMNARAVELLANSDL